MSSTTMFKGSFGERPSSRVLQPPGGGSSNIFGSCNDCHEPSKNPVPSKAVHESSSLPMAEGKEKMAAIDDNSMMPSASPVEQVHQPNQRTAFRNGSSGYNPITGEPYGETKGVPAGEKKQNRAITVRQPPGGASSGLW